MEDLVHSNVAIQRTIINMKYKSHIKNFIYAASTPKHRMDLIKNMLTGLTLSTCEVKAYFSN